MSKIKYGFICAVLMCAICFIVSQGKDKYVQWREDMSWDNETTVETVVLLSKGELNSKKVRVEFSLKDMDTSGFQ